MLAGGRGTEATVLLRFAMQTKVEQGPPCPVLQHPTAFGFNTNKNKVCLEQVPLEKCRKHRKVPLEKCEKACKKVKKKHILILVTNILQILFVTLPWLGNIAKTSHNIKNI